MGGPVVLRLSPDGLTINDMGLFSGSLDDLVDTLRALSVSEQAHLVVTLNVDQALQLQDDPDFADAYQAATVRTVDGVPIAVLGRMLGARTSRNTGADLLPALAENSAMTSERVVLLGGAPGVADRAARALRASAPGADVVAVETPYFTSIDDPQSLAVIDRLHELRPRYVFLCLGAPKQELWFCEWQSLLPPAVYIGAGAAVDFAAGDKSRAPRAAQRLGLEWTWRLAQEPRRLAGRYLVTGPRFIGIAANSLKQKRRKPGVPTGVFISWISSHGRSKDLADELGLVNWSSDGGTGPAIVRYLRLWRSTQAALRESRPEVVVVMQPPVVALLACASYAARAGAGLVGDLHTGVFEDPKWKWATGLTLRVLRGERRFAVVTNDALAARTERSGVRSVVVHDRINAASAPSERWDNPTIAGLCDYPYILVPLAYAHDEPIAEILGAADCAPEIRWVLTGRAPAAVQAAAPANIQFSGFVTDEDFERLLWQASAVLAPTTVENTMQRAGYEALSTATPLVTTKTKVLREYFGDAAIFVTPVAAEIAGGAREALANGPTWAGRMAQLRAEKLTTQRAQLAELRRQIHRVRRG